MASPADTGSKADRPSFARIAAAGIQPSGAQQSSKHTTNSVQRPSSTSPSPIGFNDGLSPPSQNSASNASQAQPAHLTGNNLQESGSTSSSGPKVHVQAADGAPSPAKANPALHGLLLPTNSDDAGTLVSSSDGDGKPPSLDGKSVASGTTFALDEKESLRPDDSASIQASAEDDDLGYPSGTGVPTSRLGSDDGVRAFRDTLHDIQTMEPPCRPQTGAGAGDRSGHQGVLYVPPEGPGIGNVPRSSRPGSTADPNAVAPDSKLLEALENPRDRIWVLKLEQDVIDFVKDAKESSLNLPQCNSFYRMLAHKIADYYMLGHSVDDSNSAVRLYRTPHCRIPRPLTGVVTPSTAASTPPPAGPQIKLLRRGIDPGPAIANGSNVNSKNNSDEESGDDKKKPVTREEREARYEAARLRIMGSAKPTEAEIIKDKDESRSSSAAGKRSRRKQRDTNDDGFEARSAYMSYYAPTYTSSGGYTSQPVAFQAPQAAHAAQYNASPYTNPEMGYLPQYGAQNVGSQWASAQYPSVDGGNSWYQSSQPYDLSKNFSQAMSFQGPQAADQQHSMQNPYGQGYAQQVYGNPNVWQQQQQQQNIPGSQPTMSGMNPAQSFSDRSHMPAYPSQMHHHQQNNYPFGQLPSQNTGRAPNVLEHPLPGSWKSPHFNPQSQAFVPGPANNAAFRPFTPQRQATGVVGTAPPAMPPTLERQMSSHSQSSSYGSSHHGMHGGGGPRMPTQPLTHPLPQPVFPRQPSPNVPLPPKPMSGLQMQAEQARYSPSNVHQMSQQNSSIAKWGAPASLPAKPPPSVEPFDAARFTPGNRAPPFTPVPASRLPPGGYAGYSPVQPLNGSSMPNPNGPSARNR